jgi:DNA-3-methyladenine glycosylase II
MSHDQKREPTYWEEAKAYLKERDSVLGELITLYEDPPLRSKRNLFETLIHSIVGQQISALAADAIWKRFLSLVGDVSPQGILAHPSEVLKAVGLSGRKVEYIQGLAREDWLLEHPWHEESDDEVRKRLCALRGVGPWTAEMILIFSLLRPDIFPLGDIGVVRSIEKLYAEGKRLSNEELLTIGEVWKPYRTVATWYLWRSLDPEPVEY